MTRLVQAQKVPPKIQNLQLLQQKGTGQSCQSHPRLLKQTKQSSIQYPKTPFRDTVEMLQVDTQAQKR